MLFKSCRNGLVSVIKVIPDLSRDVFGLAGAGLVAYGAWLAYPAAGFIVGGVLVLAGAFLSVRD